MAFINPYQTAQSQLGLTEALLGGEQKKKAMQAATAGQMGKMEKEFQQKVLAAQKAAEAQLSRKKKGGWLGKLASFASGFAGPIAGPILSGLMSGIQMKGQSDFAKRQASRAKAAALGLDLDRYGGTFLGKKARDYEAGTESMYDKMISEADVGFGDLFKTALTSGITSMAMGKAMKGVKTKMGDIKATKALEETLPKDVGIKDVIGVKSGALKPSIGIKGDVLSTGGMKGPDFLTKTKGGMFEVGAPIEFGGATGGGVGFQPKITGLPETSNIKSMIEAGRGKLAYSKGVTPEHLEALRANPEFQRLMEEGYDFESGPLKALFSGLQQPTQMGLPEGQTNLLQNLILGLSQSGLR